MPVPRSILLISFVVLVVGGCSGAEEQASPVAAETRSTSIAGLYERAGRTGSPDRLCLAEDGGGLRFGLVTGSDGPGNCTAKGTAVRQGANFQLRIDGAPACNIIATAGDVGVTLGAITGSECSYYCGEGAELTAGIFAKAGSSVADRRKAVDIVGEPVC